MKHFLIMCASNKLLGIDLIGNDKSNVVNSTTFTESADWATNLLESISSEVEQEELVLV